MPSPIAVVSILAGAAVTAAPAAPVANTAGAPIAEDCLACHTDKGLRPEKFPMDLVMFTGRVSEEELRHERPEEYARRRGAGRLDERRADPPPRWLRNVGRIVGTGAVVVRLGLFALILFAVFRP